MPPIPSGTVTFLYTDIEGSTRLWQQYRDVMGGVVARHDDLLREVIERHEGSVFRTMGDAVCAAFRTAPQAVRAALGIQYGILHEPWERRIQLRVRIAIHTGAAEQRNGDFSGHTLNRVARLLSAAHGGQILLSRVTRDLVLDDLPPEATLLDLGEHHLKDLERSEHIYQVSAPGLQASFPPLRTKDITPNNLPAETTSFVGRAAEVEAIASRLSQPNVRLLTLVGPGGTGKTRLALRVGASVLGRYRDGVFLVSLATIQHQDLVVSALASTLGIRESEDVPLQELVAAHLRGREMLLIVDNFEHVVGIAPLLSTLLTAAPDLTILVTSRAVLHLAAEHTYPVPPMSLPGPTDVLEPDSARRYDAVALFTQRAQAIKPDFSLTPANTRAVIEICQRLDGLPLAIELAVARLRLFPPEALLTRLTSSLSFLTGGAQDVPTRQQTLRGTIDWSYSLLPADQQRLFARLAVFVGGWSLQAAETICNLEGDVDVLDGIAALVEQSLVHQEDSNGVPVGATGRFSMLKTIQEYASELLGASSSMDSVHRRHAEWYLTRLQDAPDLVTGLETMIPILPFLSLEHDNVRAALRWSLDRGDWHLFAGLVRRLSMFWFGQGKWAEALSWTEAALTRMPADPTAERAVILFSSGFFLHRVARSEPATERLQAAAEIWRELPGHERELSTALYALGEHLAWQGRRAEAKHVFEEALSTGRTSGATNAPMVLTHLGILAREDGNYVQARTYMEEGLSVAREMDSQIYVTIALNSLADLARLSGDYEHAEALYLEAMNLSESAGMVNTRPAFLHNLAYVAHHRGNDVQARRQFIEALEFFRDRGDRRGMAECVAGIAVLDAEVDPVRAARLLAAATAAAETLGSHLSSSNQAEYDRAREIIRTELGDGSFRAAWDQGRALPLERAVLQARESRGAQRNGPP